LITSPDSPELAALCAHLADMAPHLDRDPHWPAEQLRLCGEAGVFEWFVDPAWGGQGWSEEQVVRGYLALGAACLTTTFILTQRTGATRRIAGSTNNTLKQRLLPGLASGELFATVGISHLTTSRRHLATPVLRAERITSVVRGPADPAGSIRASTSAGFRLDGTSPWVTGGAAADAIVLAATLMEHGSATDQQLLVALPTDLPGLTIADPLPLVGLSASSTGPVQLEGVEVSDDWLIAGPTPNVMASGVGGSTGGLETSTLAVGLAQAAIDYLNDEATRRADLSQPAAALRAEHHRLLQDLLAIARGDEPASAVHHSSATATPNAPPTTTIAAGKTPAVSRAALLADLRQRANSLVLRSTQAALSAAKGTGYVVGHPAGRWCREALFFLVWSCPQPVAAANLCELAGIQD
jgi:alkylation response protein AidB-like acyl-CoA dehydrogenase